MSARDPPSGEDRASISVALVDDHDLFRRGLREVLEEHGFDVVGEASSGEAAIDLVAEAVPDVLLMDISMPGIGGVEATRRIRSDSPHTRVVMLTVSADEEDVNESILAGASGYLLKDSPPATIASGIRAAARGEGLLSPAIAGRLLERMRTEDLGAEVRHEARPQLTAREGEVLRLMAAGKDNSEIAAALVTSPHTVKSHVSNILAKLELENRVQAAVYAVRRRIV